MTDDPVSDLLCRVAKGDRLAFRALYSAASAKLMGVLIRILQDRTEAEDALQEVFTRVWLRAGRFDPERAAGMAWLAALTRNHAIDRLRSRPPRSMGEAETMDALPDRAPLPEAVLLAEGEARRVIDCFGHLPPDRARAVRGAYLEGMSYTELAARFSLPLNTLRTQLRRSLIALRECMEQ